MLPAILKVEGRAPAGPHPRAGVAGAPPSAVILSEVDGSRDAACQYRDGIPPAFAPLSRRLRRGERMPLGMTAWNASASDPVAGMFMAIFEGQLGNSGFIERAESVRHHPVVLFLGCAR